MSYIYMKIFSSNTTIKVQSGIQILRTIHSVVLGIFSISEVEFIYSSNKNATMARQIAVFLIRWCSNLSLNEIREELFKGRNIQHELLIKYCNFATDHIKNEDRLFMLNLSKIIYNLSIHHGIDIFLSNTSNQPDWYKLILSKNKKND